MFWHSLDCNSTSCKRKAASGFGLIELLVSISIIVIVTGIVLVNEDSFNGAVLLRNETYDVALAIRQVQLSAVSAQGNEGDFRAVRGVYFATSTVADGQYIVFTDTTGNTNGFYDISEEDGLPRLLGQPFEIRSIRARVAGVETELDEVSVVFVRPNFDARFFSAPGTEVFASEIEIDIARRSSSDVDTGSVRTIEITPTGQIAVQ